MLEGKIIHSLHICEEGEIGKVICEFVLQLFISSIQRRFWCLRFGRSILLVYFADAL